MRKDLPMKATIEYSLPEEEENFRIAMDSMIYFSACRQTLEKLRSTKKHSDNMDVAFFAEELYCELMDMLPETP